MSRTTDERAKLGTTHLIPRGVLNDHHTTLVGVGRSLRRIGEDIESKAHELDHLVLWHTAVIRGHLEPKLQCLAFHVQVNSVPLNGLDRADVLDLLFQAAMDKFNRELAQTAIEESLEASR